MGETRKMSRQDRVETTRREFENEFAVLGQWVRPMSACLVIRWTSKPEDKASIHGDGPLPPKTAVPFTPNSPDRRVNRINCYSAFDRMISRFVHATAAPPGWAHQPRGHNWLAGGRRRFCPMTAPRHALVTRALFRVEIRVSFGRVGVGVKFRRILIFVDCCQRCVSFRCCHDVLARCVIILAGMLSCDIFRERENNVTDIRDQRYVHRSCCIV